MQLRKSSSNKMAITVCSIVIFGLTAVLTYFVRALLRHVNASRKIRAVLIHDWPGLPHHWFFGNTKQHPMSDPKIRSRGPDAGITFIRDMTIKYPHGYRWFLGPLGGSVVANHPDIMRAVLKGRDPKSLKPFMPNYRYLLPWLGRGLVLAAGDTWFRNRRIITHAFHFDILKTYMPLYNTATDILLDKMSKCAASGDSFVVTKNVSLCTLDILLKCAFSYETHCQINGEYHPYVNAVNEIADAIEERIYTAVFAFDFIFYRTSAGKKFVRNIDFVHNISDGVIKKRRDELSEPKKPRDDSKYLDFLGILLAARDEDGKGLTNEEIRDEVDTFLFAGHDTTASSLTWMLYVMAVYPEHQKRVQEEIDEVLAGRDSDEILWEDIGKFKYMMMCFKEAMRIFPPVPLIQREIVEKDIVVEGRVIPKGALAYLNIYALHHNPEIWPNPSEFIPDRFSPANVKNMDPFAYLPFSAGPRNCIGQNFALNEEKVVLARMLRKFHIELDPNHKIVASLQLVYRAVNDIKIKLKERL